MALKNQIPALSTAQSTFDWKGAPNTRECDLVMRGGITSGVIYPRAITEFAKTYRFRGIGGASAGAIGAAFAAAAELGRETGGFEKLDKIPESLGGNALGDLFQPQKSTRPLMRIMLAATGNAHSTTKPTPATTSAPQPAGNRLVAVIRELHRTFPLSSVLGVLPGTLTAAAALTSRSRHSGAFALSGLVVAGVGWSAMMALRTSRKLAVALPANQFGICTGLTESGPGPGLTNWLSDTIDDLAGFPAGHRPLTFGDLWKKNQVEPEAASQVAEVGADEYFQTSGNAGIQLLMMTTCLTKGRAYEMPWDAKNFYYDPDVWRKLFPENVMKALEDAPKTAGNTAKRDSRYRSQEAAAAAHTPPLKRLPAAEHLPVIVATRLSLSFPALISAVQLWEIDFQSTSAEMEAEGQSWTFQPLWFTDGGFCSNFPLHMFDTALPTRPTFAINLGRFENDSEESADEKNNVRYALTNRIPASTYAKFPSKGIGSVLGFAGAALATTRGWSDNSKLFFPGYRDRIVQVLQTKQQGGLNLHMDGSTIQKLAERGRVAAESMVDQFDQPSFAGHGRTATGWENHKWVRYRALMGTLPAFFTELAAGFPGTPEPGKAVAYTVPRDVQPVLRALTKIVADAASEIHKLDADHIDWHAREPRPLGRLGRSPHL